MRQNSIDGVDGLSHSDRALPINLDQKGNVFRKVDPPLPAMSARTRDKSPLIRWVGASTSLDRLAGSK
jgi:hypothetical protein